MRGGPEAELAPWAGPRRRALRGRGSRAGASGARAARCCVRSALGSAAGRAESGPRWTSEEPTSLRGCGRGREESPPTPAPAGREPKPAAGHEPPGPGSPAAVRAALRRRPDPPGRSCAPVGTACLSSVPSSPRPSSWTRSVPEGVRVCEHRCPEKRGRKRPGPRVSSLCARWEGTRRRRCAPGGDQLSDPHPGPSGSGERGRAASGVAAPPTYVPGPAVG